MQLADIKMAFLKLEGEKKVLFLINKNSIGNYHTSCKMAAVQLPLLPIWSLFAERDV